MVTRNVNWSNIGRLLPGAALVLMTLTAGTPAEARFRHWYYVRHTHARWAYAPRAYHHARPARASFTSNVGSNFAAMVVDANSGRTLYAVNEDAPRHPASITKVMTLYLLFEELEKGRLRLDSPLSVSAHAAAQAPTKLGLRAGSTITVENAIKAIVTKSANDMAVTVAENLAGDEGTFAEAMTQKAHALGMTHTFYHNASGLPDMRQLTTARDLTILGRAIRERFPRFYHYFSTPSFTYAGSYMVNHNHLMDRIDGMDGIKTGYTAASGFNLLSSVNRGGRHIVSVVLGGRTAAARDRVMQALIESHIQEASMTPSTRVAEATPIEEPATPPRRPMVEPAVDRDTAPNRVEMARQDSGGEAPTEAAPPPGRVTFMQADNTTRAPLERRPPRGPNLIAPDLALPPSPVTSRPAALRRPVETARIEPPHPIPRPDPSARQSAVRALDARPKSAADRPRPAFIAGAPRAIDPSRLPGPLAAADRRRLILDGSTNRHPVLDEPTSTAVATATPSSLHWVAGAAPARLGPSAGEAKLTVASKTQSEAVAANERPSTGKSETRVAKFDGAHDALPVPNPVRGGWVIQIGATPDASEANDLLSRAKTEGRQALASAHPFTEKVQKGDATLYRARFAGLDPNEAEAACRTLKRSGFACFTTRN